MEKNGLFKFPNNKDCKLMSKHRYVAGDLVLGVQGSKTFTTSSSDYPGTAIKRLSIIKFQTSMWREKRLVPA